MQLQIRSRGAPLSDEARRRIERRVRLAFGRVGGAGGPVSRVRLAIAGQKGPEPDADVRCSLLVALGPFATIQIDERDPSLDVAVQRALERASRAVERRLS